MSLATPELLEALNASITIPIVPYKGGEIDYAGQAKNVDYLMTNNYLDNNRRRVLSVAGTSLIHHIEPEDQTKIFDTTGQVMGSDGVLMSAIAPNPIGTAERLIEAQSNLQRPPDVYLIMPLGGTYSPEGLYDSMMAFGERCGTRYGARLLYYYRQPRDLPEILHLLNDSPHFVGVKIGTGVHDVQLLLDGVGDNAMVIWGIGDRSTDAVELGAKGHTSGTAVLCARAADEINNAQRRGDYTTAREFEKVIEKFEDVRFRDGRKYNYAAVVEAINQSGFDDVVGGDGGPFNPRVPADVVEEIKEVVAQVKDYH